MFQVMMEHEKETDPTLERAGKEGKETIDELYQHSIGICNKKDSIKQSKPRFLRTASTDSKLMVKARKLLYNSPRNLMSSLQHGRSPPRGGGTWRVKNNDLAVDEILKERRAAIESRKLKGKRLFGALGSSVSEMDFGGIEEMACHNLDGLVQEIEVRSVFSYDSGDENEDVKASKEGLSPFSHHCSYSSSSSFYICDDCIETEKEEEKVEAASEEEEKSVSNGASLIVATGWLTIAFVVCAIGIILNRSFRNHGVGDEVILFPT